jgi:hypothetical protein
MYKRDVHAAYETEHACSGSARGNHAYKV